MSYQQFGPNGFDFGLSAPKTGLGPGLLGDLKTLQALHAQMAGQNCDDCPPEEPCPTCQESGLSGDPGQIIRTQAPVPMPGLFPPPPIGLLPPQPRGSVIIGSPNAWWNWTPGEIANWIRGRTEARPSQDVEEMCEEQYALDTINCNLKKAYAGAGAARVCHEQAAEAYAECRKTGKKSDIPRYDRS